MKIHKILNNNVVIVLENQKEKVVCGRGIAFKKKVGDLIDESLINKTFNLNDEKNDYLKEVLADIPLEYIEISNEIKNMASLKLGIQLNNNLLVSLSDHIYNSINRFKEGISLTNVLLLDIKQFYEIEYNIGIEALKIIFNKTNVRLPEDEAGFIALHVINAENENNSIEQTSQIIEITQDVCNLVKYFFLIDYEVDSVYYYRFITHLKFFAKRLLMQKQENEDFDESLYKIVKEKYAISFKCVEKITDLIKRKYHYQLDKEEQMYLAIHIERIIYKLRK
ncbi:MAG: BglG family transcription antiterminator LicT [Thomasclavelia sp.]